MIIFENALSLKHLKEIYYIVPRLKYKKQYKNIIIKQYKIKNDKINKQIEEYNQKISTFFNEKR